MIRSELASISISRCGSPTDGSEPERSVVWMRGEHDLATEAFLVVAIARAAQRDDADVIVDLSQVTFMDASTITALVGSRNRLQQRSLGLHVRAPSPAALRVLELCDAADLLAPVIAEVVHPTGAAGALGTWVDVPAMEPGRATVEATVSSEERQPATLPLRTFDARLPSARLTTEVDRGSP